MRNALLTLRLARVHGFHFNPRNANAMLWAIGIASLASGKASADDTSGIDESFLSRITLLAPVYTRHVPHDKGYDDHNWGGFAEIRLFDDVSVIGGEFINSYRRNTVLAGVTYLPLNLDVSNLRLGLGGEIGADLNGGYKPYNKWDPLFGAITLRLSGTNFEDAQFLNHLGLAVTVIPPVDGPITAINVAVTLRL
ncbi:MAG TPA: hypothetical protein VH189_05975 [Rhizomicrobium sp.]|jgi:hypothetical protein|nr:hypothetical protein [Rhizomicrobium sp.]